MEYHNKAPIEYPVRNYEAVNSYVDEVVERDRELTRLKQARVNYLRAKNFAIVLVSIGILLLLLGLAYKIFSSTKGVASAPWTSSRIEYIKVPDPGVSEVIEKPIYIEKPVFIPVEIPTKEGVVTNFTIFQTRVFNIDKIDSVVTGAKYLSSKSDFPANQWCYARSPANDNSNIDVTLGNKIGKQVVKWTNIKSSDADRIGSTISVLEKARKYCEFIAGPPPKSEEEDWKGKEPIEEPSNKSGTGFFVSSDGYLITNEHVVNQCKSIFIKIDGKLVPATLVASDVEGDLAIIRSALRNTKFAKFAKSTRTGEDVVALGFPFGDQLGDEIKVTTGNISAMTGIKGDPAYMQFTAPIQSGNSGGPLLNVYGGIVGINTASLQGKQYQNINFAIKGSNAQAYLAKHRINFEVRNRTEEMSAPEIVEYATPFTGQVYCYAL
jgi:S1-C subfamily serine protease